MLSSLLNRSVIIFFDELALVGISFENIEFLTGDNCRCNLSLATKMSVPLVGCASHRLNLAVQAFYKVPEREKLVTKVDMLMKKLRTMKNSSKLRKNLIFIPSVVM